MLSAEPNTSILDADLAKKSLYFPDAFMDHGGDGFGLKVGLGEDADVKSLIAKSLFFPRRSGFSPMMRTRFYISLLEYQNIMKIKARIC